MQLVAKNCGASNISLYSILWLDGLEACVQSKKFCCDTGENPHRINNGACETKSTKVIFINIISHSAMFLAISFNKVHSLRASEFVSTNQSQFDCRAPCLTVQVHLL